MYDKDQILDILPRRFPQLAEPDLQKEISEVGTIYQFEEGQIIMDFNSYVKMVPLIVSGSIKVTREDDSEGREMILYFLRPGETCSMSFTCCMMNKRSEIRTEALEPTTVIGLPIQYVDRWMTRFQSWKNFVMTTYDQKMVELIRVLDSVAFSGMDQRLINYLKLRKETQGTEEIHATHQEIATDLNASREAVSRLLKKLENMGKVELGRNVIRLMDERQP